MASLLLSPAQMKLRTEARKFMRDHIIEIASACDTENKYLPKALANGLNRRFGKVGIPKEFGGEGLDFVSVALIFEEIGYADLGVSDLLGANVLGLTPILLFGSDSLRQRFARIIRDDTAGELYLALAGTEPDSGSDILSAAQTSTGIKTFATKVNQGWRVAGKKRFISNGPIACYVVTLCASDYGPTLLVVDTATEGFRVGDHARKLGHRCSPVSELIYDNVFVSDECLVGEAGQGAHIFNTTLALARPGVAIASVGAARRAYDIALDYCRTRIQGGSPLIEHQAVQGRIARLTMKLEAARVFALSAFVRAEDTQKPDEQLAIMTKVYCSEVAAEIVSEAMQLLGGNGYMEEFILEKLYRDIKLNSIYEGENNYLSILLGQIIAKG